MPSSRPPRSSQSAPAPRSRFKRQFRSTSMPAMVQSFSASALPSNYLRAVDLVLNALGGRDRIFASAVTSRSARSLANIVGAGVGYKETDGKLTNVLCVHVFVVKKLPESQLDADVTVPESVVVGSETIPTDVVETGIISPIQARYPDDVIHAFAVGVYTGRYRPAQCGASVGHPRVTAGTMGCLVAKDDGLYMLSNNHVLAAVNKGKQGDLIYQPGVVDGGTQSDAIGRLEHMHAIDFSSGASNEVDAALAMTNDDDTEPDFFDGVALDDPTPVDAAIGMRVQKVGRTTGHTTGFVFSLGGQLNCDYDGPVAHFINQIVIQGDDGPFSQPGDSGSLIMTINPAQPVGLLFSGDNGSPPRTYANPIQKVMDAFGGFDIIAAFSQQ